MQEQAKQISIIKSALTTKLSLELAYRPGAPAPIESNPKHQPIEKISHYGIKTGIIEARGELPITESETLAVLPLGWEF